MLLDVTSEDFFQVAQNMRQSDRDEAIALSGGDPADCLALSAFVSEYLQAINVDGETIAIVGLVVRDGKGVPWMLGTDSVDKKKKSFLRSVKQAFNEMVEITPMMANYVHSKNKKSIAMLRWLGFAILPPKAFGAAGEDFNQFTLGGHNVF